MEDIAERGRGRGRVLDELQRVIQPTNSQYISEMKSRWEAFYSKVQFYGVMKKAMKPPKTLNGVAHVTAVFRALPLLFPSSTMPPKKLGLSSEALFHVLTVRFTDLLQYFTLYIPVIHTYILCKVWLL
uniref:Uncharacterized protein n=1 Tax=Larimichthys crocea TaxID=215358 RepID=A0A0F8B0J7_LARCR